VSALAAIVEPGDLRGAAILAAAFLSLLVLAELWRRFGHPKPEWTRKLVHLGGGIACLFFPFLVHSPWVVLALALPLTGLFVAGGRFGFLKSLHGIGRRSRGAEYYPLSVFLAFLMTQGKPWLYLAAVLVLAVGDAFAALIGSRYGVIRYEVEDGQKSLEGSLVFLVIAFLAIHLPALLLTDLPRPVCVLAALLVAALVTGFEAISLEGADNLFVPLAVVVILGKITTKPLSEVVYQNVSLLAICLGVGLAVWRFRSFNVGGAITFILFAYGTWSLGSWVWALPVFLGFAGYLAAWLRFAPPGHGAGIKVRTLARALLPPFTMLLLANSLEDGGRFFSPYLAASAAVLAFSLDTGVFRLERRESGILGAFGLALLGAALAVLGPALARWPPPWPALLAILATTAVVTLANAAIELRDPEARRSRDWTAWRFLLSFAAAGAVLGLQALGTIPSWDPAAGP
jgi:dolichol kinase